MMNIRRTRYGSGRIMLSDSGEPWDLTSMMGAIEVLAEGTSDWSWSLGMSLVWQGDVEITVKTGCWFVSRADQLSKNSFAISLGV